MQGSFFTTTTRTILGIAIVFIFVLLKLAICTFIDDILEHNEDAEIFSSTETTNVVNKLPEEAYLPKIESIFIKTKIRFRFARTKITATIVNPHVTKSQSVNHTLRMPKEAFITRFEMRLDGEFKIYRAVVVKSQEARNLYQFAIDEGRSVSLGLIQQSELDYNELLLQFVIVTNKKILFSVVYVERLPRFDDRYTTTIHLLPNYMTNKTMLRVEVVIQENLPITSIDVPIDNEYAANNVSITKTPSRSTILWTNFDKEPSRNQTWFYRYPMSEFIVSYSLENEISSGHVLLINGYFVHFFTPTGLPPMRKHVTFILDVSDSMKGIKMNQTISAITEILDELKLEDYFNIVIFSSEVKVWSCFNGKGREKLIPFPANAKCKDEARHSMSKIVPHGSTNMYDALVKGLEIVKNVSAVNSVQKLQRHLSLKQRTRPMNYVETLNETLPQDVQSMIIFFTDGEPTSGIVDKRAILTQVKILNLKMQIPIFTLAFGESADFPFLSKLSTRNNAFARIIYEQADAVLQLENFYGQISSPVLSNLSFKFESPSNAPYEITRSTHYPMAFKGQEILTIGKLNEWPGKNVTTFNTTITGTGRRGSVTINNIPVKDCSRKGVCPNDSDTDDKHLEKLFVHLTIKDLLEKILIAESEKEMYKDYDESEANQLKEKVTQLGIKYNIVTPYTSMVMRTASVGEKEMGVQNTDKPPYYHPFTPQKLTTMEIYVPGDSKLMGRSTHANLQIDSIDEPQKYKQMYSIYDISNSTRNHTLLNRIRAISANMTNGTDITGNKFHTTLFELFTNY